MRVTIHIGTFKTATSAIQFALARSGSTLARVGARYAQAGLNVPFSKHLHLFDSIVDGAYNHDRHEAHRSENYIDALLAELADPAVKHLLLSEEELSYPTPAVAEYLAPLADVADVEIVMVVRRQPEFMESLYLQFLKEPLRQVTSSFTEFIEEPEYRPRGDFADLLEPWEHVFGRDAVTVVDFDDLRNGDVVDNFADLVGLPHGLRRPDQVINPSVSPPAGELLRLIGDADPDFPRMSFAALLRDLDDGDPTSLLTAETEELILSMYRKSNERLADRYGVDLDRSAPPRRRPVGQAELDQLALRLAARVTVLSWRRARAAVSTVRSVRRQQDEALQAIRGLFRPGDDV